LREVNYYFFFCYFLFAQKVTQFKTLLFLHTQAFAPLYAVKTQAAALNSARKISNQRTHFVKIKIFISQQTLFNPSGLVRTAFGEKRWLLNNAKCVLAERYGGRNWCDGVRGAAPVFLRNIAGWLAKIAGLISFDFLAVGRCRYFFLKKVAKRKKCI
jgi:hypothetical protein